MKALPRTAYNWHNDSDEKTSQANARIFCALFSILRFRGTCLRNAQITL
jgi:hypothetical protein